MNFGYGTALKYLAIIIVVTISIQYLRSGQNFKIPKQTSMPIFILIFISWLSLIWSISPETTMQRNTAYTLLPLLFIAVTMLAYNDRELKLIKSSIILAGAFLAIMYIGEVSVGTGSVDTGRFSMSEGNNPNNMAASFYLSAILSISMIFSAKKMLHKVIYILCSAGTILVILMTGSRGGLLGLTIALVYFVFAQKSRSKFTYALGIVILAGLLYYFLGNLLPETLTNRLFTSSGFLYDVGTTGNRSDIWSTTITYILPSLPIWGLGTGCTPVALYQFYGLLKGMHNTYLNMIVELGILGLPVFIWLIIGVYKRSKIQQDVIKGAALVGMLVIINFGDCYPVKSLWSVLMYCCISDRGFYTGRTDLELR